MKQITSNFFPDSVDYSSYSYFPLEFILCHVLDFEEISKMPEVCKLISSELFHCSSSDYFIRVSVDNETKLYTRNSQEVHEILLNILRAD